MASLKDLQLSNSSIGEEVDLANLPKVGGFTPLLQPGRYTVELPKSLNSVWEKMDTERGERIVAIFDQDTPLVIKQSPGGTRDNEPFQTRISNAERARGKDKILVSDLDYVLRQLGVTKKVRQGDNAGYINALLPYAGKLLKADVELSWYCNSKKDIYVLDAEGTSKPVPGTLGCGAKYYQSQITADLKNPDGTYPERINCVCGASVRAFANLEFGRI